jgi:hypothetical protein
MGQPKGQEKSEKCRSPHVKLEPLFTAFGLEPSDKLLPCSLEPCLKAASILITFVSLGSEFRICFSPAGKRNVWEINSSKN